MFTIIWSEHTRRGTVNHWAQAGTREEIITIIQVEALEKNAEAMIFLPDAHDMSVSPADMLAGRD